MRSLVGGSLLLLVSLFMLVGFLRADAEMSLFARGFAFALTVLLPGVTGLTLVSRHLRGGTRRQTQRDALRQQTLEAEVLRLAGQRGGRLALVEVVTEFAVPAEAAQAALDALVHREIADIAVTDSGVLIYTFHDVQRLADKAQARGILE
jgi:hypothetical protein